MLFFVLWRKGKKKKENSNRNDELFFECLHYICQ
jgi:hypothetical protein